MFAFPPLRKQLYDAYGGHHAACSRKQIMQQLRRQVRLDEKKRDERPNRLRQTRCSGQHQCISTASCRRINRGGDYDTLQITKTVFYVNVGNLNYEYLPLERCERRLQPP
jgi:hypothetical protein